LERLHAYNVSTSISIPWSAPECLREINPMADSKSDVYSFGILGIETNTNITNTNYKLQNKHKQTQSLGIIFWWKSSLRIANK